MYDRLQQLFIPSDESGYKGDNPADSFNLDHPSRAAGQDCPKEAAIGSHW